MNNLNNGQIVLLAILVSFVTSIATGIFTVTLLEQAPAPVTTTISKVVQTTVEKITPTKETVVERVVIGAGGELVRDAITKGEKGIFEIVTLDKIEEETSELTKKVRGIGIFLSTDGLLISRVPGNTASLYVPIQEKEGETLIPLDLIARDEFLGVSLFRPNTGNATTTAGNEEAVFPAVSFAETSGNVGQTAIVLNGSSVAVSFLSGLITDGKYASYELFLSAKNNLDGAIVMNVENNIIGILDEKNNLIPSTAIKKFVDDTLALPIKDEPKGTTGV